MVTNGKKKSRDPHSHLEPRDAALRLLALREQCTEDVQTARINAEQRVRQRYSEKQAAIIARVGEQNREKVLHWADALERDAMGKTAIDDARVPPGPLVPVDEP